MAKPEIPIHSETTLPLSDFKPDTTRYSIPRRAAANAMRDCVVPIPTRRIATARAVVIRDLKYADIGIPAARSKPRVNG
jgi:hypothetical protein